MRFRRRKRALPKDFHFGGPGGPGTPTDWKPIEILGPLVVWPLNIRHDEDVVRLSRSLARDVHRAPKVRLPWWRRLIRRGV